MFRVWSFSRCDSHLELEVKTQTEAAELFDISQQAVSKAGTESSQWEKEVPAPDHLHGSNEKADFRKLSPEGQERVRNPEVVTLPLAKTPEVPKYLR